MAEINMVSCCTCGYEWRQGQDGSHSCAWHMAKTIERQAAEIERLRDALLWTLWHKQGGSSPIGQPIRRVLGIRQFEALTPEQVECAKRFGEQK